MQVLGTFHKRKSVEKVIPQMPKRKISQNSRQKSRTNNRTQYSGLQSPQVQLKNYKRKNFKILSQLQTSANSKLSRDLKTLATERTEQTKLLLSQQRNQKQSISSFTREKVQTKKDVKQSSQITSRFTEDHHKTQQSLAFLINQTKSKDSNPLINTARLKQDEVKGSFLKVPQINQNNDENHKKLFNNQEAKTELQQTKNNLLQNNQDSPFSQINIENTQNIQNPDGNNFNNQILLNKPSDSNINENQQQNDENQQNQNEGQNFDDYQFGGKNSNSNLQSIGQASSSSPNKKKKNNKLMPPPKTQPYTNDIRPLQKLKNWRQHNRYIPQTQQQHRMAQQHLVKERQKLTLRREQQQIMNLIQQYQMNKNSLNISTKRKIQTNRVIQKIYKDKRESQKHSMSLPQLKKNISHPKKQILIPEHNQIYSQAKGLNIIDEKFKVKNIIAKSFEKQKHQLTKNIRHSLSYSKLGFGSRQSRNLFQDQIKQSEIQNVQKIQKKLRQKGIQFDSNSIRKGLLNLRDMPTYKISSKSIETQNAINQEDKLQIPQKQLPSNAFYKIFPL